MRALLLLLAACGSKPAPATRTQSPPTPTTIEIAASLTEGPGNIAMTEDGRMFVSLHQFYAPTERVVEVMYRTGGNPTETRPIAEEAVDSVLGIRGGNLLFLLDNGMRNKTKRQLVVWNHETDTVRLGPFDLTAATPDDAFLNDLAVDSERRHVYIADPAGGKNAALVVVDIADGKARRVLEGHASVVPENIDLVIDGKPVEIKQPDGTRIRPRVGVNPIAIDDKREWLYFGPMHGTKLYRVRAAELADPAATPNVELYAERPITDGIAIDNAGNIYLGDLANNAIGVIEASTRTYRELVRDPRLSWVDAFSFGPDGYYYVVTNQLHRSAVLNAGTDATQKPFHIVRFKPLAPGDPYR